MNKLLKVLIAATAVAGAATASAEVTDIIANKPYSAYVQDQRDVIARSGYGLCWRTGYWTPADAIRECDPAYAQEAFASFAKNSLISLVTALLFFKPVRSSVSF